MYQDHGHGQHSHHPISSVSPTSETWPDNRFYHHVLYLAKLENYGLAPKPMVQISCVPEQDLFEDSDGHPDQEGL